MATGTGTLPVGATVDGTTHTKFELRAQKLRDSSDALDDRGESANRVEIMAAIYSKRLVVLGTLPKEKITADLVLDMDDQDIDELTRVSDAMKKKPPSEVEETPASAR
jgi:hypothetical protein